MDNTNSVVIILQHPTISTAAYQTGFVVGGLQTLSNALSSRQTGILNSLRVLDRSNQRAPLDVILFSSQPTAAATVDHAAFSFSTDDLKVIAIISILTTDYVTVGGKALATAPNLGQSLAVPSGTTLYAVAVTSGTPIYTTATDIQFVWGFITD